MEVSWTPAPSSLASHCSVKSVDDSIEGSARIWLRGGVLSSVLNQVGVGIAAFASKTTDAVFSMRVFVGRLRFGITVKSIVPLAPGGRKPAAGSAGGRPVVGSSDWNVHLATPVDASRPAFIASSR